jgi:hypothetical protein
VAQAGHLTSFGLGLRKAPKPQGRGRLQFPRKLLKVQLSKRKKGNAGKQTIDVCHRKAWHHKEEWQGSGGKT